jgi:uncharacterized protein YfaT (DUF1175 family)
MSGAQRILPWTGYLSLAAFVLALAACSQDEVHPSVEISPSTATADGASEIVVHFRPKDGKLDVNGGKHAIQIRSLEPGKAILRVGILAAQIQVRVTAADGQKTAATLTTTTQQTDAYGDGTPDFLRLPPSDQEAFRRWFRFLSEAQYYRDQNALPKEITDCAALLRYAYRESLAGHDGSWANRTGLPQVPSLPPVRKYEYPFTPLNAALFRTRPGPFQRADLGNGAFAEFADAQHLKRWNCHFLSRDLRQAAPGDLLFYRQIAEPSRLPFHSMIFLGPSVMEPSSKTFVIYHTGGPEGIRRLTVEDLIGYPLPQWRPIPGNENFLGVFRWNILR